MVVEPTQINKYARQIRSFPQDAIFLHQMFTTWTPKKGSSASGQLHKSDLPLSDLRDSFSRDETRGRFYGLFVFFLGGGGSVEQVIICLKDNA